jgi:hypothetical protein
MGRQDEEGRQKAGKGQEERKRRNTDLKEWRGREGNRMMRRYFIRFIERQL